MVVIKPEGIGKYIEKNFPKIDSVGIGEGKNIDYFTAEFLDTAIAVCLAESGGNTNAKHVNSSGNGTDYGLWQINSKAWGEQLSKINWRDPDQNTALAGQIWKAAGGSFTPWTTYKSGAYKKYLGHGQAAKDYNATTDEILSDATNLAGIGSTAGIPSVSDIWDKAFSFIKESGIVVGIFLLGLIMIVLGIVFIVSQSKTVKSAATKVIP